MYINVHDNIRLSRLSRNLNTRQTFSFFNFFLMILSYFKTLNIRKKNFLEFHLFNKNITKRE